MSVTKLKDGRWIVYYVNPAPPPRLKREYFGRGASAQLAAEKRNTELHLQPRKTQKNTSSGPLFMELAADYASFRDFSPNSLQMLLIRLEANILPAIGNVPALKLSYIDMDRYVRLRRAKGVKSSTIRREITDIKAILNWSAKRRPPLIPYNPVRDYAPPAPDDAIISPPTLAEAQAILAHANQRLFRAIKLAWYTGMRPGAVELFGLTWGCVLWDRGVIQVRSADKGGAPLRDVPIHDAFMPELRSWWIADGKGSGPIIHYRGERVHKLNKAWKRALQAAGITRRLRPYDFRHFFITSAIEAGTDYKTVSEIVGSSPETLRRHYQHVSNDARRNAITRMPELPTPDNMAGNIGNTAPKNAK